MMIRFFLFSLVVAGFALLARIIVTRTRHLEKRQLEANLSTFEREAGDAASVRLPVC